MYGDNRACGSVQLQIIVGFKASLATTCAIGQCFVQSGSAQALASWPALRAAALDARTLSRASPDGHVGGHFELVLGTNH